MILTNAQVTYTNHKKKYLKSKKRMKKRSESRKHCAR